MADFAAPTLTSLTLPTTIDLSNGDKSVVIGAQAQDNAGGTGISSLTILLDKNVVSTYGANSGITLGTSSDTDTFLDNTPSTATTNHTFRTTTNPGVYNVSEVRIFDIAGNSKSYYNSELKALGINTSFTVTDGKTDMIAPNVLIFSPADEATGISIGSNIVVTFSEAIAKGTGNIVLKSAAGTVMATYDAATSSNLSISGSTLTINPTADLSYSTGYKIEFAIGSIKDIAGNNFAGTSGYNFMTVAKATANHTGTSGNDIFTGTAENDNFDGGNGIDTSVFSGSLANYALTKSGSSYIVLPKSGTDGTDTHTNVEDLAVGEVW